MKLLIDLLISWLVGFFLLQVNDVELVESFLMT